jgi:predicted Rossmann-fold nucleotide-binding protein
MTVGLWREANGKKIRRVGRAEAQRLQRRFGDGDSTVWGAGRGGSMAVADDRAADGSVVVCGVGGGVAADFG